MKGNDEYMLCDFLEANDANKDKMKRVREIWMSEMFSFGILLSMCPKKTSK
jgi:hypothetical protein